MPIRFDPRFSKSVSISDAVSSFIREEKIEMKLKEVNALETFKSILPVSSREKIEKARLKDGKLIITVNSASLKNDLHYSRVALMEVLAEKLGHHDIKKIVFE